MRFRCGLSEIRLWGRRIYCIRKPFQRECGGVISGGVSAVYCRLYADICIKLRLV